MNIDTNQIITICQKHNKKQTNMLQIPTNCYICMNKYCPNAYTILCNLCKNEHRDHQVKILTIEDIAFLIDRLLKMPFKQVGTFISQSVQILRKLKLINQFSKKITKILRQFQQQTLDFIAMTQNIVSQYAQCKNSAIKISQSLLQIQNPQNFLSFQKNQINLLNKIDYNIQKDRLEYGSLQIKQKQDLRKKNLVFIKRRIEQVKEYSMKIIQVILNNDDSDQENQDMAQKKKIYETLKNQVWNFSKKQLQQRQSQALKQKQVQIQKLNAQIAINNANFQKKQQKIVKQIKIQTIQSQSQTDNKWIQQLQKYKLISQQLQENSKILQRQLEASTLYQKKIQSDYKSKIYSLQKQRESLIKQKQMLKKQKQKSQRILEQKTQLYNHYEYRLRDNYQKRVIRYKQREEIIKQLSELVEHQRIDGKSGRQSVQKENRRSSKSKSKKV